MSNKIEALEELARAMIGDGQSPDLFFVTDRGQVVSVDVCHISAYERFIALAQRSPRKECVLENRTFGVIASVEPDSDEPVARLILCDDYHMFKRMKRKRAA